MRHFLIVTVSILLVFVAACSKHQQWERSEIAGYNFSMVSKTVVRSYTFADNGAVNVESGSFGGPLTKAVYFWEIDGSGTLILKENSNKDAKIISKVTKLGQNNNSYKVSTAAGRELTFLRTKALEGQPAK